MDTPSAVSVIIPTFNRRESLGLTLDALNSQTYPPSAFEVIVVDDGSTDGTCAMLEARSRSYRYRLVVLKSERRGPGSARNRGLDAANGDIVLFTDSDCLPHREWVELLSDCVASSGAQAGGRIEVAKDAPLVAQVTNYVMNSWLGGFGRRWGLLGFLPGRRLRTMNAGVLRTCAKLVGGFRCSAGSYGEDTEFGEALERHGWPLDYCESAVVYHREDRKATDYMFEAAAKGVAQVRLFRRGAIRFRGIHILPMALVVLLLGTVVSAISPGPFTIWVWAIWAVYAMLLQVHAFRAATGLRSVIAVVMVPPVAFSLHLSYGVGSFLGLVAISPPRKGPSCPTWQTKRSLALGVPKPKPGRVAVRAVLLHADSKLVRTADPTQFATRYS